MIGVTENLNLSSAIFEKYLPKFFTNFQELCLSYHKKVNSNHLKKPLTENARRILETELHLDIEFYDFVLQRLNVQAKMLSKSKEF